MNLVFKVVQGNYKSIYVRHEKSYQLEYTVGTTVKAKKGSLGIFCFDTLESARDFINEFALENTEERTYSRVLVAKPFGKKSVPKVIADTGDNAKIFYLNYGDVMFDYKRNKSWNKSCFEGIIKGTWWKKPIKGTVCYPKVKVIAEISQGNCGNQSFE